MWPGFDSRTRRQMWAEFVCSRPCSESFFSGYSGFPLSSKTNISKFQFDLEFQDLPEYHYGERSLLTKYYSFIYLCDDVIMTMIIVKKAIVAMIAMLW